MTKPDADTSAQARTGNAAPPANPPSKVRSGWWLLAALAAAFLIGLAASQVFKRAVPTQLPSQPTSAPQPQPK